MLAASKDNKPVDLTLSDLSGNKVHLRDYRGHPVVLNFWATWCGPCKEELPLLTEFEKTYKDRGVVFIAASLDEAATRDQIPLSIRHYQLPFAVWRGATADDLARLKMGDAVPATAFIDQEGRIVARVSGEIRKSELIERLEWLVGDHNGPRPPAYVEHLNK